MGDASFTQSSFLGGEISPYMQGRFDRQDYRSALNVCLNALPVEEGAWTRRPGTRRLAKTRKGKFGVLREFHFAEQQPYDLEFTGGHLRMFAGTSLVTDGLLGKVEIAGISSASPAVVTTRQPHGMTTLDEVQFEFPEGVSIPTAARLMNHQYEITVISATKFSLADPVTGAAISGAGIDFKGNPILVARILDIATSFADDQDTLRSIRVVQGQDTDGTGVALIMCPGYQPLALRVVAVPTGCVPAIFSIGPATFKDGPYMDPIADKSTATPSALTGTITLTVTPGAGADRPAFPGFVSTDVGRLVRLHSEPPAWLVGTAYVKGDHVKWQDTYWTANGATTGAQPDLDLVTWSIDPSASLWTWGAITVVTSATVVSVLIKGSDLLYSAAIKEWRLGLYSNTTGWPKNGTFHEGRLWLSGAQANRFDAGKSNDFFNFAPTAEEGTVADDNGIAYVLNSKDVNPIFWMEPDDQGFLMGTQDGEWHVRASSLTDPLTPTSIQAKRVTKYGCADIEPRRTGLSLCLVQRDKKNVLEYVPDPQPGKFSGQNISLKGKHLCHPGVGELAYVALTTPIVWARTDEDALIGCTYKRDNPYGTQPESFSGWHRHALAAPQTDVTSLAAGPSPDGTIDALLMVTVDPDTGVYWVEVLTPVFEEDQDVYTAWFLDHAIRPPAAEIVTYGGHDYVRLWGLDDYEGDTVQVWGAGLDLGDFTVSGGYIDVQVSSVANPDFSAAQLAALTVLSDTFAGFAVTITRPNTGTTPVPASANLINEFTPAYPSVSQTGVAVNWDANYLWITRQGNTGNALLRFSTLGGASTVTKTITNIFGSEGGGEQFVQQPICYDAAGAALLWSSTSSNSGKFAKYNPDSGVLTTLGSSSVTLTNTAAHIMKGLTQSPLSAGDDYVVVPSLVGSPGINDPCSVAVINTTTMAFFEAVALTDQRGVSCSGANADFDCYHTGTAFILGGEKPSLLAGAGFTSNLSLYSYTVSVWGNGTPGGDLVKLGGFGPAAVDATWTHFQTWEGLIYDATDGNVIAAVHTNDVVTHTDYIIKINARDGSIMWATPVVSIPASSDDWNETRIENGVLGYIDGAAPGVLSTITTATGAVTTRTLTGVAKGYSMLYDDVTGRTIFSATSYSDPGVGAGNIRPKGTTPSSFSNAWATLDSSGTVAHPIYEAPFVVGYTYTSDGQIVRPIAPQEAGAANGPALAKTRRAHQMTALMHKAKGVSFGTDFTKLHAATLASPGGTALTPLQLYSGTYWNTLEDNYSFDSMICWRITRPYPTTVLAIGSFLHTQDR